MMSNATRSPQEQLILPAAMYVFERVATLPQGFWIADMSGQKTKKCCACKEEKPCVDFGKDNTQGWVDFGGVKRSVRCRACESIKNKKSRYKNAYTIKAQRAKYREENRGKINERAKAYRENNRQAIRDSQKKDRIENPERYREKAKRTYAANRAAILEQKKDYHSRNKLKRAKYHAKYRQENKEKLAANHREYVERNKEQLRKKASRRSLKRYREDPVYNLSERARRSFRRVARGKSSGFFRHLPYTANQLYEHLITTIPEGYDEADMVDGSKLHIDHIRPVSSFNLTGEIDEEFHACWALDNLQLLPAEENLIKRASLDWQPQLEKGEQLVWRWIA